MVCPTPAQHMVFPEDVRAVAEPTERLPRREQELQEPVKAWRLHPVVAALQALRGGQCTVAVTPVAERGDLTRCQNPRPLRKSLRLSTSASSMGERRRQGAMTTAGPPCPSGPGRRGRGLSRPPHRQATPPTAA